MDVKVVEGGCPDVRVVCVNCGRSNVHAIVTAVQTESFHDDDFTETKRDYQVVQCRGCERFSFREWWTWSGEDVEIEDEQHPIQHVACWPKRVEGLKELENAYLLPTKIRALYRETYAALNAEQPVLATVGLRGLIEGMCTDKKAQGNNLKERINALVTVGALAKDNAEILHRIRFLGNEAAHELAEPDTSELDIAQRIVHNLLENVYVMPELARRRLRPPK